MVDRATSRRFPPYAYVPGHRPHPTRHPAGHSHGRPEAEPTALDPDAWRACTPYLEGLALFDHGYYWEAHEAWEGLWIAAGRRGAVAELLRGLIALAAAGVKVRQGAGEAAARLGARAKQRFERAQQLSGTERLAGLAFDELSAFAEHVARDVPRAKGSPELAVEVVFARALTPDGLELPTG
jgi:hypothetical protein